MLIREALAAGARLQRACNEAGICLRTWRRWLRNGEVQADQRSVAAKPVPANKLTPTRSEEHTSELQSRGHLVCRLLLQKKKKERTNHNTRRRRSEQRQTTCRC